MGIDSEIPKRPRGKNPDHAKDRHPTSVWTEGGGYYLQDENYWQLIKNLLEYQARGQECPLAWYLFLKKGHSLIQ